MRGRRSDVSSRSSRVRRARSWVAAGAGSVLLSGVAQPATRAAGHPSFRQLAGRPGCVTITRRDGCTVVRGAHKSSAWTLSPDGRNLYGIADGGRAIVVLRKRADGGFAQLPGTRGCLSADGRDGCQAVSLLPAHAPTDKEWKLAFSPSGTAAFLLSEFEVPTELLSLVRDPATGALRPAAHDACVTDGAEAGCAQVHGFEGGGEDVAAGTDGRDIYVAAGSAIAHLRRDPDGGLHQRDPADCFSAARRTACVHSDAIPEDGGDAQISIPPDDRNVYVSYSGDEDTVSGTILEYARDRATGALAALPAPNACVSQRAARGCTGWGALNDVIDAFAFVSPTGGYLTSMQLEFGEYTTLIGIHRDADSGALTPVTCWGTSGNSADGRGVSHGGEPCTPVPEWSAFASGPLVTSDRRNLYVLSESGQNFADLPPVFGDSSLLEFAFSADTAQVRRLTGPRACLGAAHIHSCTVLAPRFVAESAAEAAGGRAIAISAAHLRPGPGVAVRLLARDPAGGLLTPVDGRSGCASPTPTRACRRIRGFSADAYAPALTSSRDGRYLYLIGDSVATLRVRP